MSWQGLDRRNFPRVIYPCMVKIKANDGHIDATLTHTENIGGGGICFIVKKDIKLFTEVELEIDLLDAKDHLMAKGKVVWAVRRKAVEEHKPMFYDIGIEFVGLGQTDKSRLREVLEGMIKKGAKLLKPYV